MMIEVIVRFASGNIAYKHTYFVGHGTEDVACKFPMSLLEDGWEFRGYALRLNVVPIPGDEEKGHVGADKF